MTGTPEKIIQWLFTQDRSKLFDVSEHKEKRSLNANAYAWTLIGKIADAIRSSKDEVYIQMLKRYGQSEIVSIVSSVEVSGYLKYYEIAGETELNGKPFTHYKVFKGSSEYNTHEMSVLIDGIVSEAKLLGIETLTPAELQRMKESWR